MGFSARALARHFDRGLTRALAGADFEAAPGERVAIVGRTGSGKSTLLLLLALLDQADGGELDIDGSPSRTIRSPEAWRAETLGVVFQFHHLLLHLNVEENLELPLIGRLELAGRRKSVAEMLDTMSLGHRAKTVAARLSGGERQLLSVGRALIHRPRAVLADEPTGSVDRRTGDAIMGTLLEWARSARGTLVVVTHDHGIAASLDRTVTMEDGRTC